MAKRSLSWPRFEVVTSPVSTDRHSESPSNAEALPCGLELTAMVPDQTPPIDSGEGGRNMDSMDLQGESLEPADDAYETASEYGFPLVPQTPIVEPGPAGAHISQSHDEVQPWCSQPATSIGSEGHLQPAEASDFPFFPPVSMMPVALPQPNPAMPCETPTAGHGPNQMMYQIVPYPVPCLGSPASTPAALQSFQSTCGSSQPFSAGARFAFSNDYPSMAFPTAIEGLSGPVSNSTTVPTKKDASKPKISRSEGSQPASGRTGASSSQQSTTDPKRAKEGTGPDPKGTASCSERQSVSVPQQRIREKLLSGCTDRLSFLIQAPDSLAELDLVKRSGFQKEVQNFLFSADQEFSWSALSVIKMPAYQSSANYGISDRDSKILGVVAIKSSDGSGMLLRISVGIWLHQENSCSDGRMRKDPHVLRRVISQVVLQVFGAEPLHKNFDVRRNRFKLEGVDKTTPMEVQITCSKNDESQPEADVIDLKAALDPDGFELLKQIFKSKNLKLSGQEEDFVDFAKLVSNRFKSRPPIPKCLQPTRDSTDRWLPGDLLKCTISEQLTASPDPEFRKELDGHIVVLLLSRDPEGKLPLKEDEDVLVAVVDIRQRKTYLVPRIALKPLHKRTGLEQYLADKYKFEVLVSGTWQEPRRARLCMKVVGSDTCMVQFEDGCQAEPQAVDPDALMDPRDKLRGRLKEGAKEGKFALQEVATLASSEQRVKE